MISEEQLRKDNMTGKNHEGLRFNSPVKFLTASSVIGDRVENSKGEHLGTIKDVMLDITGARVEYYIMEYGGFLGFWGKLFAIPVSALRLSPKDKVFIVEWNKQDLEQAPGFNKKHWPETNKHYEDATIYWGGFMGPNTGHDV